MTWLGTTLLCVVACSVMFGALMMFGADRPLRAHRIPFGVVAYALLAIPAILLSLYCFATVTQHPRWWEAMGLRLRNWLVDDEGQRRDREAKQRRQILDREIAAAEKDRLQALLELRQALLDHRQALVELRKEIAEEESKAIDRLLERTQSQDPKELN